MTNIISSKLDRHMASAAKLGLSGKAASVYVTMLDAGEPLSPKALILKTGLHRQYVYDGIRELENRKLAVAVGEGKRVRYGAVRPDTILADIERTRIDALGNIASLMHLYNRSPLGVVEIVSGADAFIASEFALLAESGHGDFLDIIGGAGNSFVELFAGRLEEYEALRAEKDISIRYIGAGSDVEHNRTKSVIKNESRFLAGIENIVNVCIRPESVSFNIYEPEIMTVRIRSASAVQSQRALFEVLWGVAKEEDPKY